MHTSKIWGLGAEMAKLTGYKVSELGQIPQDWNVVELGDVLKIRHGKNQKEVENPNGTYPILATGGQIGWATEYLYDKPSVLIGRKGTIDKPRYQDTPFWTVDTLFYSEIGTSCSTKFIFYKFCLIDWIKNNEASGVPSQNAKTIEKIQISLPPLPEQTAIATALSDTDALISSLQTLIAKKQAIKLSAMQNLLSGKIRLPEFAQRPDGSPKNTRQTELGCVPEDWEVVELGSVAFIKTGSKNNQDKKENGQYPFFVRSATVEQIDTYSYDCEAILIPGEGNIGSIFHYINGKFDAHQRVYVIRDFYNVIGKFVFFALKQNFGKHAMENTVKATVDSLRLPTFQNFKFAIPKSTTEQTAIAQLLSDMDAEIEVLECRLKKTQALKQGMMQALLTGKIRLPLE